MTKFKSLVDSSVKQAEAEVSQYWNDVNILEKTLEKGQNDPSFVFYEGPPTANGNPGIHHVIARTLKDSVCRYKTMNGYQVKRKAGWDTHGLPVEIQVEKELGLSDKQQIEAYGLDKFNEKCRVSVFSFEKQWREMTERMAYEIDLDNPYITLDNNYIDYGLDKFNEKCRVSVFSFEKQWREMTERMAYEIDLDNPYITLDNNYIESVWWILDKFNKEGYIYEGHKILPYCPRCGTGLASHEVAQGYKEVKNNTVIAKFKRVDADEYFLAWTTTPWTLPSNVALTVGPEVDYVKVKQNDEVYYVAKALANKVLGEDYEVLAEMKGKDLECGTGLASHEVAQGYKEVKNNTVIAKFKRVDADEYFLAWTTTPWTLPSNVALTVGPEVDYVKVKQNDEVYYVAKALANKVLGEDYEVLAEMKGKDLEH